MDIEKIFNSEEIGGIIMKYYVEGKVFENQEEALKYENGLAEEKRKQEELKVQKKARIDEIEQKQKEVRDLINQFYKDYGVNSGLLGWLDLFL